jgi:hypothetical protein
LILFGIFAVFERENGRELINQFKSKIFFFRAGLGAVGGAPFVFILLLILLEFGKSRSEEKTALVTPGGESASGYL